MVDWNYDQAFVRNRGLISPAEQPALRQSRVAIVGQGGVGGVHAVTLARLGVGRFTLADPDIFETANFNRQYGAFVSTQGKNKADVMASVIKDINPEADVRVMKEPIGSDNASAFLEGADLLIDGIDAFEISVRRLLFQKAQEAGIPAITAGPIGFSAAWINFSPLGMRFDRYFDFKRGMDDAEQFASFIVGLVPAATQRSYVDLAYVNLSAHTGPSASLACQLCAGVAGAEAVKILLKRGGVRYAPYYHQFDAYKGVLVAKRLWGGEPPSSPTHQETRVDPPPPQRHPPSTLTLVSNPFFTAKGEMTILVSLLPSREKI